MDNVITPDSLAIDGRVVATDKQLRTPNVYRRLKAKAAEMGTEIEIVNEKEYARLTGKKLPLPLKPDKDGFIIGDDGVKRLAIINADAQSYAAYVAAKRRAAAANVELVILLDEAV